jgi:hypothetical protein
MIYRLLWLLRLRLRVHAQRLIPRPTCPPLSDGVMLLAAAVDRGTDCWAAREPGECVTCGHDWITGEIIGPVFQQYARLCDGTVRYWPEVRRACCVCVERQRVQGDPSLQWARDAGALIR